MRNLASRFRCFARRLEASQATFTAKDAKDAKGAKEEQLIRSVLLFLCVFAPLAPLAVKTLCPPPLLAKANP